MTAFHDPELRFSDSSNTNSGLVAGQAISNAFVLVSRMVSGGGKAWNEAVLVTLPCGVRMVMGPEMASGGTTAVMRRSKAF